MDAIQPHTGEPVTEHVYVAYNQEHTDFCHTVLHDTNSLQDAFHEAICRKEYAAIDTLLAEHGWGAFHGSLHLAICEPDPSLLKFLLERGAYVHEQLAVDQLEHPAGSLMECLGETALHLAIRAGKTTHARLLIHSGADVRRKNGQHLPPIAYALSPERYEQLALLLYHKADPTPNGLNPLRETIRTGNEQGFALLLRKTKNLRAPSRYSLYTEALLVENDAIFLALLKANIPVNGPAWSMEQKDSPLHVAVWKNNLWALQKLLEKGASSHHVNYSGYTPLSLAKKLGRTEIITLMEQEFGIHS